jgi:hypothetical protein
MIFLVEFDNTIIDSCRSYDDLDSAAQFLPYAKQALSYLKNKGHTLILFSARANKSRREVMSLDPLYDDTCVITKWVELRPVYESRYQQMLAFVEQHLPGIFDHIDDGTQGKPIYDVSIDGASPFWTYDAWLRIMRMF